MSGIAVEVSSRGIATITLDRPERSNAFDQGMLNALAQAFAERAADTATRIVVLRGAGKHFCGGADLVARGMEPAPAAGQVSLVDALAALDRLPKPTIAVVHGAAVGGGAALAACCDIVLAADGAFFSIPEVRVGMAPLGVAPFLIRAMGHRSFRRYGLSGERFGAAEALRIGLVHEVVSADRLEAKLIEIADALLHAAPGAVREMKAAMEHDVTPSITAILARRAAHGPPQSAEAQRRRCGVQGKTQAELVSAMTRHAVASVCLIAAVLLACPRAQADDALYEAAKKEGQVVWYTSLIVNQAVRPLVDAFNKKYPGVEVKYARGDSGPNAIKVINEARAGRVEGDVFDGIATTAPLLKAGLVEPFTPSEANKYPSALRDPDGRWNALVVYFLTPGVNTQLVGADEIKTAQDLLNPKWQGKIAWSTEPSSGAPVYVGSALQTMGEDKGMAFLRALAKQDIVNVDATNRAILDQVILGQYAIALSIFNHHAVVSAKKGAPVAWLKVEPIPAPFHSIGLVKNAPHPNAGKLLIDFLLSEEGQRAFADVDYLPAMPSVPAKTPEVKPEAGGFSANFISPATASDNIDRWVKIKKELFN